RVPETKSAGEPIARLSLFDLLMADYLELPFAPRYSSTDPPAASIAALAPLVTERPLTVPAFLTSPEAKIFARLITELIKPACFRVSISTTEPSTAFNSDKRISALTKLIREVKPYFGRRNCTGI